MKKRTERLKKRRDELFRQQHGRCHWCKCQMQQHHDHQQHGSPPKNLCTLDHLYDRLHPKRLENSYGEQRYVAACWECNWKRGRESQAALPKEELWRRSRSPPTAQPQQDS